MLNALDCNSFLFILIFLTVSKVENQLPCSFPLIWCQLSQLVFKKAQRVVIHRIADCHATCAEVRSTKGDPIIGRITYTTSPLDSVSFLILLMHNLCAWYDLVECRGCNSNRTLWACKCLEFEDLQSQLLLPFNPCKLR
jgi:hypothetical protein